MRRKWFAAPAALLAIPIELEGSPNSLREDISKEVVPPTSRREKGRKYLFVKGPEFMDAKPAIHVINEALAAKGKP